MAVAERHWVPASAGTTAHQRRHFRARGNPMAVAERHWVPAATRITAVLPEALAMNAPGPSQARILPLGGTARST